MTPYAKGVERVAMAHVDFYSFSFPVVGEFENDLQARPQVQDACIDHGGGGLDAFVRSCGKFTPGASHRPFSAAIRAQDVSAALMWNHKLTHAIFEMAGTACMAASESDLMIPIIAETMSSCVRIDIAIDIPTRTTPVDFVNEGWNKRFTSTSLMRSQTGETIYIGSRSSERFCRVYKYAAPHPRAGLLRIEFECKGDEAKRVARAVVDDGSDAVAAALVGVFGFRSQELAAAVASPAELPPSARQGGAGETVRWLYAAVAPALAREIAAGKVDPQHFWDYVDTILREL